MKHLLKKAEFFVVWNVLWKYVFKNRYMASPVEAAHKEYSMIYSASDDYAQPSERLLDLITEVVQVVRRNNLSFIKERFQEGISYPDISLWPGEHYRLLSALVQVLQPKMVIEIGTSTGISALAMKEHLPKGSRIITFDVVGWEQMPGSLLKIEDFADGKLAQYTDDLTIEANYEKHKRMFEEADMIFVDAKKDGQMESVFIERFKETVFNTPPLIVFDDIKNWMMLGIWRKINRPKMDITSLGHFTGTGLVDWTY